MPSIAGAADQVVTNANDSGAGSLRQAVVDVSNGDTITFASDLNINLTSDQIIISKDITIDGESNAITVSAATNYRVFFIMGANTVTIKNLTIRDGDADTNNGGGIYNQGELTLEDCVFIDNQADSMGGGIYNQGELTLENCIFINNQADSMGGAICNFGDLDGANATLINCTFNGNFTPAGSGSGGAIENYADAGQANMTLINCTISGSSAEYGGGIENYAGFADADANLSLTNCTVSGNSGYDSGGISNYAGMGVEARLNLTDCTVSGNSTTSDSGGGIFNYANGTVTADNCLFDDNYSDRHGGGIYNQGGLSLSNCTFRENEADNQGGAIYNDANNAITADNCRFENNSSNVEGGAIQNNGGDLTLTNCALSGNSAANGGGINNKGDSDVATMTLTNCTLSGNSATTDGGGIVNLAVANDANLTLTNCTLSNNSAGPGGGGGIYSSGAVSDANLTLTNCTLSSNDTSSGDGGGICNLGSGGYGNLTLTHCTLNGNYSSSGSGGGIFNNDQLRLRNTLIANSPSGGDCDNSGGNIAENTRNLVEDGSIPSAYTGDPKLGPLRNNGGSTQTHALLSGSPCIDTADSASAPSTDQRGVSRPQDGNGDGLYRPDIGAYELGTLGPADMYVSDEAEMLEALETVRPGGTIIVDNDISLSQGELVISKSVTIQSESGNSTISPDEIADNARIFHVETNVNLTLEDLTLQGGSRPNSVGGAIYHVGGATPGGGGILTARRCTFTANEAKDGGAIFNLHGILFLENCTFSGNIAYQDGGAVCNDTSYTKATLHHCTLCANMALQNGGGIYNAGGRASLENSLIAGNYSGGAGPDLYGAFAGDGYNLIGNRSGASGLGGTDRIGYALNEVVYPRLADNGGGVLTHDLVAGGPAVDAGDPDFTGPPDFDQRGYGFLRVRNERLDIGAVEDETIPPTVITTAPQSAEITGTSVIAGGYVTNDGGDFVTERGLCWGLSPEPDISGSCSQNGSGTGAFSGYISGLTPASLYYLRAYATNGLGTGYGNEVSFRTDGPPQVSTAVVSEITSETAVCGGTVTDDGGAAITARGVCWSVDPEPRLTDDHSSDGSGTGPFTSELAALSGNTGYHVRAYASNAMGTAYGETREFTTANHPPADILLSNSFVQAGQPPGIEVGALSATDPDENESFGFSLVSGSGDTHNPLFAIEQNLLQTAESLEDERQTLSIRVRATDGHGGIVEKVFEITVGDAAGNPVILGQQRLSVPEDRALPISLDSLTVADPLGEYPEGFSPVLQAGEKYQIDGDTVIPTADFHGELAVPVRVQTPDRQSDVYDLAITVTPVNDAPEISGVDGDGAVIAAGDGAALLDAGADGQVFDVDNPHFSGGFLRVFYLSGEQAQGAWLGVQGDAVHVADDYQVFHQNRAIGFVDAPADGQTGADFQIHFDAPAATTEAVAALLHGLTFQYNEEIDESLDYDLGVVLNDGESNSAQSTVSVRVLPQNHYLLTITISPENSGTVSGAGLSCDAGGCMGDYEAGEIVSLTAAANADFIFDRWEGAISGTDGSVSVPMGQNQSVIATFKPDSGGTSPFDPPDPLPHPRDSDNDGVPDYLDQCPGEPDIDTDTDGVLDCLDECPEDPDKTEPGQCGCGEPDSDSDGDGILDCKAPDPDEPEPEADSDNDGVPDSQDQCPGEPDTDTDNDGVLDCLDRCPEDPDKTDPGQCGCGEPDIDSDGDGILDCNDPDPDEPEPEADSDNDGVPDYLDQCPGEPDSDSDNDGVLNCMDECPSDPGKADPGQCGCGIPDTDMDGDQTADCADGCPADPAKTAPGVCGCGFPDSDSDGDQTADCHDHCPRDPNKLHPGLCGCGISDADSNGDGIPDCQDSSDSEPGTELASYYREVQAGTRLADFELVSFYLPPPSIQAPQTLKAAMDGQYNRKNHRIGGYNTGTGGYIECDEGLELVSGKAYWFLARHGMTIHYTGPAPDLNQKFALPLNYDPKRRNGWNLIGPPKNAHYDWQKLEILVYDEGGRLKLQSPIGELAPDNPYLDPRLWCWEGGGYRDDGRYLVKGFGCWVRVRQAGVVLVFGPRAVVSDDALLTAGLKRQHRRLLDWLTPSTALADTDGPPLPPVALDETAARSARVDEGGGSCFLDVLQMQQGGQ